MTITKHLHIIIAGLILGAIASTLVATNFADAAFPNLYAKVATSTTIGVGPQLNKTISSTRDNCASRVVTTAGSPIMLAFDSNMTPTASVGHIQASSTSEVYDAELYGCGAMVAFGVASSTITVTDFKF